MKDNREKQDGERLDGNEVSVSQNSTVVKKLDNFWFHYKWPIIIGAFFLIIFIIGIVQISTRESYDGGVTYAGPVNITPAEGAAIEAELSKLLPEDYTKDNKKNVKFSKYMIYTEDDLKDGEAIDTQLNSSNQKSYQEYVGSGDCSIFILSRGLYENLKENNRLYSMGDVFGNDLPEGIDAGDFGVQIKNLDIYRLDAFKVIPEDSYVCIAKPLVYGASSKQEAYSQRLEFFKALVD